MATVYKVEIVSHWINHHPKDVEKMIEQSGNLMATKTAEELHFRKGQLDILHWIRTLKKLSEEAWEQINNE